MSINLSKALLASFVILLTPTISFAQDNPLNHCPSVSAISAVGVDFAEQKDDQPNRWFVAKLYDNYGTDYAWLFMTVVSANTKDEAITKANAALSVLTFTGIEMGVYCGYQGTFNGESIPGIAIPASEQLKYSFQSMKSLIH